ncbi:Protein of unknown function [Mucilaginibacter mallensis]|uniref:DUF1573 domain-containing protein n=1 Tax=Mucilaginibacter mallensis TaxID=652787 RepID=A0A1H2B309_MUCMA|nr:DUF1573 domain-containing protein [Mucilaginibacter mallensis]SDT52176.1 Protein of unknown function [Mucilaginibacter mallensis]
MKFILISLIGVILALNILLLVRNSEIKQRSIDEQATLMNQIDMLESKVLKQTIMTDGFKLSTETKVEDESGKEVPLKTLMDDKNKVILRFSPSDCLSCVNAQIDSIKRLSLSIGSKNILLLVNYNSQNDLKILKKKYALGISIYNLPSERVSSSFETVPGPYFFLLSKDLSSSMVFTPSSTLPKCTSDYLAEIQAVFNKTNSTIGNDIINSICLFKKTDLNIGTIKKGHKAEAVFILKNTGKYPLLLNKVTPSCSCTVAGWQHLPIQPGDTSSIRLQYDSGKVGYFNKDAFVFMNSANSPVRLVISGEIVE